MRGLRAIFWSGVAIGPARLLLIAVLAAPSGPAAPPAAQPPPLRLHGSIEPLRSYPVATPRLTGSAPGQLVIVHLVRPGTEVKRGDVLIEFDRQAQLKTAHDRQAEYLDFVAQIARKRGEQLTMRAHDEADLAKADTGVSPAELDRSDEQLGAKHGPEGNRLAPHA